MKYFRMVFIGIVVIIGSSCMSTVKASDPIKTEAQYYIIPEIGVVTSAYIGDPLLKEGMSSAVDAIYLNEEHGKMGWTAYHPKGIYKLIGKKDDMLIYEYGSADPGFLNKVYPQIIEYPDGKVYLIVISGKELLSRTDYQKRKFVEESGNDFEQTLIYTGADGTLLKFSYREFSNNMARAAFTVDTVYDIKNDKIIRFRGALLEIVKVDNQSITYKVLSGFK